jgi:hypothetical protein
VLIPLSKQHSVDRIFVGLERPLYGGHGVDQVAAQQTGCCSQFCRRCFGRKLPLCILSPSLEPVRGTERKRCAERHGSERAPLHGGSLA